MLSFSSLSSAIILENIVYDFIEFIRYEEYRRVRPHTCLVRGAGMQDAAASGCQASQVDRMDTCPLKAWWEW